MRLDPNPSLAKAREALIDRIDAEASQAVDAGVMALSDELRSRTAPAAILFYGSGIWQSRSEDQVLDFYVLVDDYQTVYGRGIKAVVNRLLPPNVYFLKIKHAGRPLRCKYAVMRVDQFARGASRAALTPQVWARFAQPCRISYVRDEAARRTVAEILASAAVTFHARVFPLMTGALSAKEIWCHGLGETFKRELRSEGGARPEKLYNAAAESLAWRSALAAPLLPFPVDAATGEHGVLLSGRPSVGQRRRAWAGARLARAGGKAVSLLRLMKAAFTFDGGAEYLLWKIERHSGVRVEARPWQLRHPLLGGWSLMWKLYWRGGFR